MSWSICPIEYVYRADFYAYAVSCANIPVNSHIGSVYAEFIRRL
jgi:hypothetical protein